MLGTLGVGSVSRINIQTPAIVGGESHVSSGTSEDHLTYSEWSSGTSGGGQIKCQTTCKSNGSCMVKMLNGPPGPIIGTCFPPPGSCSGIPYQCQRGNNMAQQCGIPCRAGIINA